MKNFLLIIDKNIDQLEKNFQIGYKVDTQSLLIMHTLTGISLCNSKEEYPIDNRNT